MSELPSEPIVNQRFNRFVDWNQDTSESRRAKVTDSSEEFDKTPWHDAADRIRIQLRFDTDSCLGQQLGAADLGCPLVESPQRLLASLRG